MRGFLKQVKQLVSAISQQLLKETLEKDKQTND